MEYPHFEGCSFKPTLPPGRDLTQDRILLHCCCAPCSTAILEWMVSEGLRPGIFFSNSNIVPLDEYLKRRDELARYAASFGLPVFDDDYDHASWLEFVRKEVASPGMPGLTGHPTPPAPEPVEGPVDLASIPERGPRCLACFKFRLLRAARYASANGYTLLTTTLASSRWKDLAQVDEAGRWAVEIADCVDGVRQLAWWNQNWRKGGLQERRSALIKSCNLYNQTWCGCEFSLR